MSKTSSLSQVSLFVGLLMVRGLLYALHFSILLNAVVFYLRGESVANTLVFPTMFFLFSAVMGRRWLRLYADPYQDDGSFRSQLVGGISIVLGSALLYCQRLAVIALTILQLAATVRLDAEPWWMWLLHTAWAALYIAASVLAGVWGSPVSVRISTWIRRGVSRFLPGRPMTTSPLGPVTPKASEVQP